MHVQEFFAAWPHVLYEMQEYVALTNLSLGHDRLGVVNVSLSRRLVAAEELQPHINQFRANFAKQFIRLRLEISAVDIPAHTVKILYRS